MAATDSFLVSKPSVDERPANASYSSRPANFLSLTKSFVKRDLKIRFEGSYLGPLWIVIEPMILVLTLSFVFYSLLPADKMGIESKVPYPLFFYAGLLPWNLFRSSLASGCKTFIQESTLIQYKVFPKQVLLLKNWTSYLIEFLIASVGFLIASLLLKHPPTTAWLYLPVLLFLQFVFSYGLMMLLATLTVFIRDIGTAIGSIVTLWFWATPVVFNFKHQSSQNIAWIYHLNPMAGLIEAYRDVLLAGNAPKFSSLVPIIVAGVVVFVTGWVVFHRKEHHLADAL